MDGVNWYTAVVLIAGIAIGWSVCRFFWLG